MKVALEEIQHSGKGQYLKVGEAVVKAREGSAMEGPYVALKLLKELTNFLKLYYYLVSLNKPEISVAQNKLLHTHLASYSTATEIKWCHAILMYSLQNVNDSKAGLRNL